MVLSGSHNFSNHVRHLLLHFFDDRYLDQRSVRTKKIQFFLLADVI